MKIRGVSDRVYNAFRELVGEALPPLYALRLRRKEEDARLGDPIRLVFTREGQDPLVGARLPLADVIRYGLAVTAVEGVALPADRPLRVKLSLDGYIKSHKQSEISASISFLDRPDPQKATNVFNVFYLSGREDPDVLAPILKILDVELRDMKSVIDDEGRERGVKFFITSDLKMIFSSFSG